MRVLLTDAARILRSTGLLILEVGNSFGALDDLSDQLHPIWVDLEQGGHGVAVFMAQDLAQWAYRKTPQTQWCRQSESREVTCRVIPSAVCLQ